MWKNISVFLHPRLVKGNYNILTFQKKYAYQFLYLCINMIDDNELTEQKSYTLRPRFL
jgi:hypothetical protein